MADAPRFRGSLLVCLLLIAYASLYPFVPIRAPGSDALTFFFRPRYYSLFDVLLNMLAYAPVGALACLVFRRTSSLHGAIGRAVGLAAAFSLLMEVCQFFIAYRVASSYDVAANTTGALIGALGFVDPFHALVTKPLGEVRERTLIPGTWGDAGLVLVALWLIAQLNPALPFFEAGNIGSDPESVLLPGTLNAIAVAMSICGFGLFISVLLKGPNGALRVTLLLLTAALWLKFTTASLMLKPHLSAEWLSEGRVIGLVAGIAVFLPLRRFARPGRIYLSILLLLAGALFSKIFGAYSALDDLLRLFSWSHGQLASFASLTRYIHEVWPLAALGFLAALFVGERRAAVRE